MLPTLFLCFLLPSEVKKEIVDPYQALREASVRIQVTVTVTQPPSSSSASSVSVLYHHCGSGTVIQTRPQKTYILSCAHLIPRQQKLSTIDVFFRKGKAHKARVVAINYNLDLLLLVLEGYQHPVTAKIAQKDPSYTNLSVLRIGYPFGKATQSCVFGKCRGDVWRSSSDNTVESLFYLLPSESGNSGGGIFHPETKELLGVVWGGTTVAGGHKADTTYATRLKHLLEFVKVLEKEEK